MRVKAISGSNLKNMINKQYLTQLIMSWQHNKENLKFVKLFTFHKAFFLLYCFLFF